MSEISALTSYQKNRDLILNKKEDYYKKNTQPANIGPQDVHVPLQRPQDIPYRSYLTVPGTSSSDAQGTSLRG